MTFAPANASTWTGTATLNTAPAPGAANTIQFIATDDAGNSTDSANPVTITVFAISQVVDSTGPTITYSGGGVTATIQGADQTPYTISGQATDASGVASITLTQNTTPVSFTTLTGIGTATATFVATTPLAAASLGVNAFEMIATDASPAANQTTHDWTVTLDSSGGTDTDPPTVAWITPPGDIAIAGAEGTPYTVEAVVTDVSGVASATINTIPVTPDGSGNVTLPILLTTGVNTVTIDAIDASVASNDTGNLTHTITLQPTLGPTLTVTNPGSDITIAGSDGQVFGVTGQATSPFGVQSVTVNGQPVSLDAQGNFTALIILSIGQNQVTVVATDAQVIPQSTTISHVVTLTEGSTNGVTVEISPDQLRIGVAIHERGVE